MDLLIVAREAPDVAATAQEITDPVDARRLIPRLPHGPQVADLFSRLALGVMVLGSRLDRGAARSAIGVALQRSKPRGVVLLGHELGRELLGEGLHLSGGIRDMFSKPVAALGQAKTPEVERILSDLCQRAGVPWAPPSTRAAAAKTVVRADEAISQAAILIEQQQWRRVVDLLQAAEPLPPRGTNMLGRALIALGETDAARHAFERTLAADPINTIAQKQLAALGSS